MANISKLMTEFGRADSPGLAHFNQIRTDALSNVESIRSNRTSVAIQVQMLDDSVNVFQVQFKAPARILFEEVCNQLNLLEADYFGLQYFDVNGISYWLDVEKRMNQQVCFDLHSDSSQRRALGDDYWKETSISMPFLQFAVKFYTPDPALIEEEYTRYLFCLQIKRDLATGSLHCNDNTASLLASYIVQGECGDFVTGDYPDESYLSSFKFVPHQDENFQRKIMENHKQHLGQTPIQADVNLLETARRCELYGIKMHPAKDCDNISVNLSVSNSGCIVYHNFIKINTFSWSKVRKISFKRKKFLIKLHPEGYGYYKDTVEYFFADRNQCKNFWKKCVEHHSFFRCVCAVNAKEEPREKRKFISRGSSFRYIGKTQKEMQEFVRENFNNRQRSFTRSIRSRTSSSGNICQSRSYQPLLPFAATATSNDISRSCGAMNNQKSFLSSNTEYYDHQYHQCSYDTSSSCNCLIYPPAPQLPKFHQEISYACCVDDLESLLELDSKRTNDINSDRYTLVESPSAYKASLHKINGDYIYGVLKESCRCNTTQDNLISHTIPRQKTMNLNDETTYHHSSHTLPNRSLSVQFDEEDVSSSSSCGPTCRFKHESFRTSTTACQQYYHSKQASLMEENDGSSSSLFSGVERAYASSSDIPQTPELPCSLSSSGVSFASPLQVLASERIYDVPEGIELPSHIDFDHTVVALSSTDSESTRSVSVPSSIRQRSEPTVEVVALLHPPEISELSTENLESDSVPAPLQFGCSDELTDNDFDNVSETQVFLSLETNNASVNIQRNMSSPPPTAIVRFHRSLNGSFKTDDESEECTVIKSAPAVLQREPFENNRNNSSDSDVGLCSNNLYTNLPTPMSSSDTLVPYLDDARICKLCQFNHDGKNNSCICEPISIKSRPIFSELGFPFPPRPLSRISERSFSDSAIGTKYYAQVQNGNPLEAEVDDELTLNYSPSEECEHPLASSLCGDTPDIAESHVFGLDDLPSPPSSLLRSLSPILDSNVSTIQELKKHKLNPQLSCKEKFTIYSSF